MITQFSGFAQRLVTLFALTITLTACGGGGGGSSESGGFLGDSGNKGDTAPLAITTTALPEAVEGQKYTAIIDAQGGTSPYTWKLANNGGSDLIIDQDAILTGTAPAIGDYGLTLSLTDAKKAETRQSFILTVTGDEPQPLKVATENLPDAQANTSYTAILQASGGTGSYLWTLVNDGDTGLDMRDDGVLKGNAPSEGSYAIIVSVTDDKDSISKTMILKVGNDSPLTITTNNLPPSEQGKRYAAALKASGGAEDYKWDMLSSGDSGLSLSRDGVLSGRTLSAGTFGIVVKVSDGIDTKKTALTLTVNEKPAPEPEPVDPLKISTETLPPMTSPVYAASLKATGGSGRYIWSLLGDEQGEFDLSPEGALTFTGSDTPAPGSYTITVSVKGGGEVSKVLSLEVTGGATTPIKLITNELPEATEGKFYAVVLQATGGSGSYDWELLDIEPAIPNGPSLDNDDGVLSWTKANVQEGTYFLSIKVWDETDTNATAIKTLTLTANPPPTP